MCDQGSHPQSERGGGVLLHTSLIKRGSDWQVGACCSHVQCLSVLHDGYRRPLLDAGYGKEGLITCQRTHILSHFLMVACDLMLTTLHGQKHMMYFTMVPQAVQVLMMTILAEDAENQHILACVLCLGQSDGTLAVLYSRDH